MNTEIRERKPLKTRKETKKMKKSAKKHIKVRHPIGVKLGAIFSSLVILVLGITVALVYILFANDQRVNAKSNTISLNETTANAVQLQLQNIQGNTNNFLNVLYVIKDDNHYEEEADYFFEELCTTNPDILFVYTKENGYRVSKLFAETVPGAEITFNAWLDKNQTIVNRVGYGAVVVKDLSEALGVPYTLGTMFKNNDDFVCVAYNVESLKETCFKNANATYIVNSYGEPLIYEDNQTVIDAGLVPSFEIVDELLKYSNGNEYIYKDSQDNNWIYIRMNILDETCSAITLTSESSVLKAINLTALRIIASMTR